MDIINQHTETKASIETELKKMIVEVIGEDFITENEISTEDTFTDGLEMESIEIVQFADLVKSQYGEKADLTTWLSDMGLEKIIDLKLQEVIDFIEHEITMHN
ncbi:acyl carrier protein [Aquimarina sp. RZ0]|uniref:acyl carrier protein n=1 Tax=Aquimarina sp. RZ0 TaxID=2607730 RepID=UPI0011F3D36B|nr:acyl carrier protein [Aquimarina sp. RZ0]KAA1246840.1 acyl carrier protein [Aquimarina sp. RZ0]